MMMLLRLFAAAVYICSMATARETQKLRRSVDPDLIVEDDAYAAAIADVANLYKALEEDYTLAGCLETWGEFPTAETKNEHLIIEDKKKLKGGMLCNCGMLYDLALSATIREEDNQHETIAGAAIEDFVGTEYARDNTKLTQIQSWVMARTANAETKCSGGYAVGYPCKNVDLISHKPLNAFIATNFYRAPRAANDVWGWTSSGGREFVIWGVREGMFFFEVLPNKSDPLLLLGFLPSTSGAGWQHDMKVVGEYAYIGAESEGHGMQIFDMRKLVNTNPNVDCVSSTYCQVFTPDRTYRGSSIYDPVMNSHNMVANEETKYVYVVGSPSCKGGLHVVDVWNPLNPTMVACYGGGGYVHDAQCVVYKGPDQKYKNKEICFCYNQDKVDIVDVSNKDNIQLLSSTSYSNVDYTHQGWLSSDHKHIVFGDEGDEADGLSSRTRTLVMNVEILEFPNNVREFFGTTKAIDHNQYVINAKAKGQNYASNNDLIYQANYEAGMRILQVIDYSRAKFKEIGYFDTYPFGNGAAFNGAWSVYPYFESGNVVISSMNEGLFLVKPRLEDDLGLSNGSADCDDDPELRYIHKNKEKQCGWVGRKMKKRPNRSRRRIKRRCKRLHEGKPLWDFCKETCGKVGLGNCANLQAKTKRRREVA